MNKVQHSWLKVYAMTKPMKIKEEREGYGGREQ